MIIKSITQIFRYTRAEACNEFAGPITLSLHPGNTVPFEEMSHRWRAIGNAVSDLTGPRFEPQTTRSREERVTARTTGQHFIALILMRREAVFLPQSKTSLVPSQSSLAAKYRIFESSSKLGKYLNSFLSLSKNRQYSVQLYTYLFYLFFFMLKFAFVCIKTY